MTSLQRNITLKRVDNISSRTGNARVVANQNGEVEQVNHYYPYGGLMGESTNSDHQPYKYNGKELDRHHGLDWFDYGARWYNGYSWMTPDPHAESYYDVTPYKTQTRIGYDPDRPRTSVKKIRKASDLIP